MGLSLRQFTKELKLVVVRRLEQGLSIAEAARARAFPTRFVSLHAQRERQRAITPDTSAPLLMPQPLWCAGRGMLAGVGRDRNEQRFQELQYATFPDVRDAWLR
jgi:hypothetical protein